MDLDDLYRATPRLETRDDGAALPTLHGYFARFNQWTEISSAWEGNFMESLAPGCATKTISERGSQVRCLFDHGYDPTIGNKPLGPFEVLEGDDQGIRYEVPLLPTDYNRDFIVPAAGSVPPVLGASFRFRVVAETWNEDPGASEYNPKGLPERVISEIKLYEGGPVTFPAYAEGTTPGLRSLTDEFALRSLGIEDLTDGSPLALRALERFPNLRTLAGPPEGTTGAARSDDEPPEHSPSITPDQARARARAIQLAQEGKS